MKPRASLHPALASILDDAASALAHLDAERLEELVRSSRNLLEAGNPPLASLTQDLRPVAQQELPPLPQPLQAKLNTFARMLDLTRENLLLMRRLGAARVSEIEYTAASLAGGRHGNN